MQLTRTLPSDRDTASRVAGAFRVAAIDGAFRAWRASRLRRPPRRCGTRPRRPPPPRPTPSSSASRNSKPPASSSERRRTAGEAQGRYRGDRPGPQQAQSAADRHRSPGARRRNPDRRRRGAAAPARRPRAADPRLARFAPLRNRRSAGGPAARRPAHAAGAAGAAGRRAAIAAHRDAARLRGAGNAWPRGEAGRRSRRTGRAAQDHRHRARPAGAATATSRRTTRSGWPRWSTSGSASRARSRRTWRRKGRAPSRSSRQVDSLQGLIAKMEQDLKSAAKAAATANLQGAPAALNGKPNLGALKDPARLSPAIAFASAKGLFALPVNGVKIRDFGGSDGVGGVEKGISLATRAGAQVTTPCDGWVVYAGPFRSYGQLLILNAGGGYHVLIAGMERISVNIGQFVLTGEPVATMGIDIPGRIHSRGQLRASPCSMSSSVRTALQSIQAHGGPQMKAKRFADDAQDFCNSPQRRHRRGIDAVRDPAARRPDGIERACRDLGHLSPAQSVRRRVRAGAQRLCREARRQQAGRIRHHRHADRPRSAFQLHGRQDVSTTCRCRPAASSAASASRSRWKTA